MSPSQICVARIGAAHGVRGAVKLWTFTEDPLAVKRYGPLATKDGARQFEVSASRDNSGPLDEPRPDAIASLAGGTYYVDLSRASMKEIESRLDALASAPGVVFDLRGYPNGNHDVLTHLTDTPIQSAKWNVPRFIYPDRERIAGWETSGRWELEPSKPRFRGRIVFLTDARAISYAESVMGIVEHYHLGEIVGQPTAGANGNVNRATLPGGFTLTFTGMKVLKHDDSQHYLIGIRPTVPVARTRAAVIEGRDEALEKALQLIRSAASTSPPSPPRSGS